VDPYRGRDSSKILHCLMIVGRMVIINYDMVNTLDPHEFDPFDNIGSLVLNHCASSDFYPSVYQCIPPVTGFRVLWIVCVMFWQ
jgi:hypothetical protein